MSGSLSKVSSFIKTYPVVRGMASYAVLWPVSSIIQQTFDQGNPSESQYDWGRAFRFGLFGSCFVAPTLFMWVRLSTRIWPGNDFKTAIKKAFVEQFTYGPCAMVSFYFGMSALERKPVQECIDEVKNKAWPTYKVAVCFWPAVQTINFYFIPEKNRVVFVSVGSLLWTCFLAHMKSIEKKKLHSKHLLTA